MSAFNPLVAFYIYGRTGEVLFFCVPETTRDLKHLPLQNVGWNYSSVFATTSIIMDKYYFVKPPH
jgi:hypothetical protein